MKEVFISYSSIDFASADTLRNVLEKNGLSCWMAPRDIPGGSNYTKEIPIAIRNCKVFVLILSKNAQNSHWVLKELDSAVNCGKVILPFMLEDCALNDEFNFLLTGAQRYSAYQKKAEAIETLISRIRGILDIPCPGPSTAVIADEPKKKAPQPSGSIVLTEAVCVACGSSDLKPLPKKVRRQGVKELATMLLIPILAFLGGWTGLLIGGFISFGFDYSLMTMLMLIGAVGGAFAGDCISKTIVRRNRIRSRIRATCYRCNTCKKVFLYREAIEN